jgi:serine/threonine-protein kinase RsbW
MSHEWDIASCEWGCWPGGWLSGIPRHVASFGKALHRPYDALRINLVLRMNSSAAVKKTQIVIGNSIAEMAKVADLVDRFGTEHAIPQRAVDNLNVCLDELLNNTISYGYQDDQAHGITIELSLVDEVLSAEVRDDAAAFDPRQAAAPAFDGRIGGLGIHFVRSLMDQVDYARVGDWNVVKISKKLQPEL